MKKHLLTIALALLAIPLSFSQNFSSEFLDGTVMFKLRHIQPETKHHYQTDKNDYGLIEDLSKYPEISQVLAGLTINSFERPSYHTRKPELMTIFRVTFNEYAEIDRVIKELSKIDNVEFAEKEPIYTFDFVPNDTWHTGNDKWYHTVVGSEDAWNISLGSSSIKVAIVDNAVFGGHQDLSTYLERDVADNDNDATPPLPVSSDFGWSHGTHCAGLATADINNNLGIASLGGNVELIGVKATPNSATSSGSIWYGYTGVQWACQNGADVVSMSYGSSSSSGSMQTLINAYPDIVFLAAAGNDGNTTPQYPGAYNNVICVGSVDANDSRSSFSNYNGSTPFVDLASPGGYSYGGLLSTVYTAGGNNYSQMGGTSMATPFAAGLVGLMLSENPTLTPTEIETCLISTGVNINENIGPRMDALAAMQCVQSTLTGDPIPYFTGTPLAIVEGETVAFTDQSADGGNPITAWTWAFPGGIPNSFVGQNPPLITYNTAGVYDVTLTVTNSQSTQSTTQSNYITVSIPPYGEWIPQNSSFSTATVGVNHISIVDPTTVWATGYDGSGGGANLQTFTKTTDGGLTWNSNSINVNDPNLGISMIHAFDANTAWLAAYPTGAGQTGGIWKTTNGGTTWTRQNTAVFNNAASFTNVVHFWDANTGFCQGDPINGEFELYTTTNGGTTWVPVPGVNIPNPSNGNEFGYTRGVEVVGDDVWFTTSLGRVYHSDDKGLTWSVFTTPIPDFGGAVTNGSSANLSFSDPATGLIVDNNSVVYKTTNGGNTWNTLATTGSVFASGLCYIEGTNLAFTTGIGTGTSGSSYSEDGGVTWNIIDTEQHLYVEFTNPSVGWSGWFNVDANTDGIWKWNNLSSAMIPDFSASTTNTCIGTTIDFTDLTTGSTPISWQWTFPGGTPSSSTSMSPSIVYNTAGTYDVSMTVDDGLSQTTYTLPNYITIIDNASTPSSIIGTNLICENGTETYAVTNDPGVVYNWTIPAGWTGSSTTNSITVTADANPGTISVTAENLCGNSSPSSLAVTVVTGAPTAAFTSSNSGADYDFTSTSMDATSWSWDFGDSGSSTQENPSHTYTSNGTFTVTLIATNSCGSDTITQSVTITGVGIDENELARLLFYPNPTKTNLHLSIPEEMLNNSFEVSDIFGKVILKGSFSAQLTTINVENWSSGIYFIKVNGLNGAKRFMKE